jgi:predicted  nucleic acid-binding Zn-ribbon protein
VQGNHVRGRGTREIQTVRCLACGTAYAKPARGGTTVRNPGCPECGYVGWRATGLSLESADAARPRGRLAESG